MHKDKVTAISELQLIAYQLERESSRQRGRGKESNKRKDRITDMRRDGNISAMLMFEVELYG